MSTIPDRMRACENCGEPFESMRPTYQKFCNRKCQEKHSNHQKMLRKARARAAMPPKPPRKPPPHRGKAIQINNHERRPVVLPGEETKHIKGQFTWEAIDAEYKKQCKELGMPTEVRHGYRPLTAPEVNT